MLRNPRRDFLFFNAAPQQFLQRRGFALGDPARHDQIEIPQVRGHVVRKSVRSDPAADVNSDGRELFFGVPDADPDSRLTGNALSLNPELRGRLDHGLFQSPYVPNHVATDGAQVQNRIAHDLSGPVISNVSAAASLVIFHAFLPQYMLGSQQVFTLSVS